MEDLLPRRMATMPVRTISNTPEGRSTSSRRSIFSSPPVISMISDSGRDIDHARPEDVHQLEHMGALVVLRGHFNHRQVAGNGGLIGDVFHQQDIHQLVKARFNPARLVLVRLDA